MAKTVAEKHAAKIARLRGRTSMRAQKRADDLEKATANPMDAIKDTQTGAAALQSGAAAGAAAVPQAQALGEALLAGADSSQVASAGQAMQKGVADAGMAGASLEQQQTADKVQQAEDKRTAAQQTIKDENAQLTKDIIGTGMQLAGTAASFVAPTGIATQVADKATALIRDRIG